VARVAQGGRVRVIFANAGPNLASSFHVIGGVFDAVYAGHFADVVRNEETVLVPPGSAVVAELTMPVPGVYPMVDHALWRAARGAVGLLHVDPVGVWPQDTYDPPPPGWR
jgi:nitrite reductase (NO-forming)